MMNNLNYKVGLYCRLLLDDGYSGLNFNRPSFQRLLNNISSNKINMVSYCFFNLCIKRYSLWI